MDQRQWYLQRDLQARVDNNEYNDVYINHSISITNQKTAGACEIV